jgi:hypothetical protein
VGPSPAEGRSGWRADSRPTCSHELEAPSTYWLTRLLTTDQDGDGLAEGDRFLCTRLLAEEPSLAAAVAVARRLNRAMAAPRRRRAIPRGQEADLDPAGHRLDAVAPSIAQALPRHGQRTHRRGQLQHSLEFQLSRTALLRDDGELGAGTVPPSPPAAGS